MRKYIFCTNTQPWTEAKKKENLISHDMIVGSFIPNMYSMRAFDIGMSRLEVEPIYD